MSFDDTFDYKPAVKGLKDEISELDKRLAPLVEELNNLQSAEAYVSEGVIQDRIIRLQLETGQLDRQKTSANEVIAEIKSLDKLSAEQKDHLYYFYSSAGATKIEFMAKLLFNQERILTDKHISALKNDNVTNPAAKSAVAKVIYQSYIINPSRAGAVMAVYRYVG